MKKKEWSFVEPYHGKRPQTSKQRLIWTPSRRESPTAWAPTERDTTTTIEGGGDQETSLSCKRPLVAGVKP